MVLQTQMTMGMGGSLGVLKDGSRLSKRIGWMNAHGGLQSAIQYSEVKDMLLAVGDNVSMQVLKDMEKKAPHIRDPTGYLKAAVQLAIDGSSLTPQQLEILSQPGVATQHGTEMALFGLQPFGLSPLEAPQQVPQQATQQLQLPMMSHHHPHRSGEIDVDAAEKIRKRVQWLNMNAGLLQPLDFGQVVDPLLRMEIRQAMELLKNLEENASQVSDTNAYVAQAAQRASVGLAPVGLDTQAVGGMRRGRDGGGGGAGGKRVREEDGGLAQQLRKRIQSLNLNGNLMGGQLVESNVIEPLVACGSYAMDILKNTEENALSVRDTNGFVLAATRVACEVSMANEKLRKRVDWLNTNFLVHIGVAINYPLVVSALLDLDCSQAMQILQDIECNPAVVGDPNSYIVNAAMQQFATAPPPVALPGIPPGIAPIADLTGTDPMAALCAAYNLAAAALDLPSTFHTSSSSTTFPAASNLAVSVADVEENLKRRVDWLNTNIPLLQVLDYSLFGPALLALDFSVAMEILKELEDNAATIHNPTAYVAAAANRNMLEQQAKLLAQAQQGLLALPSTLLPPPPVSVASMLPPPVPTTLPTIPMMQPESSLVPTTIPMMSSSAPVDSSNDEKLRKRIGWLNNHGGLLAVLRYDQVGPALLHVGNTAAFDILKALEEQASIVQDPNSFVIMSAEQAISSAVSGNYGMPVPGSSSASAPVAAVIDPPKVPLDEKIRKRVMWLNRNANLLAPLSYEEIAPDLMQLNSSRHAMEILKQLEEHATQVLSPDTYVKGVVAAAVAEQTLQTMQALSNQAFGVM